MSTVQIRTTDIVFGDATIQSYAPWSGVQDWHDMTSSRSLNTNYLVPASTATIWVAFTTQSGTAASGSRELRITFNHNFLPLNRAVWVTSNGYNTNMIVPVYSGDYYSINATDQGIPAAFTWWELW